MSDATHHSAGHPAAPPSAPRGTDGVAIAALVASLLALGPVAIVLGVVALRRTRRSGAPGRGLAVAGIMIGSLGTVVLLVLVIAWLALLPTQQVAGGEGQLVTRSTNGTPVNATLTTGGEQWQTFDDATVWGGESALLRPDESDDAPGGVLLLTLEGQGFSTAELLADEGSPVVQFAPSTERDAVLLQTEQAWFRVGLEDGAVGETEELFPRYHDASMDGWPLLVRWAQEPPAEPSEDPSESPTT